MDKVVLGFADRVVLVSESIMDKLNPKWVDRRRVLTIPNAVDPAEFQALDNNGQVRERFGIAHKDFLAGVIGRFSPEKGHVYLIDALPQIVEAMPHLKVMLIGDGQEKENIQKRINELDVSRNVVFTGYQEELGPFYSALDLLVLPSLSEGMPNVVLEAMLSGKPVLATRVGGVPEVVVERVTGRIVDSQSPDQLAKAILDMFQNPELLLEYGLAGRQRVQQEFHPAQRLARIAALYEELLQSKKASG